MPISENKRLPAGDMVSIDAHAVATLSYIRASMDAASSLPVPGSTALAAGSVGLAAAGISSIPGLREHWLDIWIAAAFLAAGSGALLLVRHSAADAFTIAGSPARKFVLCFAPSLAAGAVLTGVHWTYGGVEAIPGTWLMLYGGALVAASAVTIPLVGYVGAGFFATGVLALFAPAGLHVFFLGLGFGVLHLLLGFLLRRAGIRPPRDLRRGPRPAAGA